MLLLNLGSGPKAVEGWTNIDRSPSLLLDRLPGSKRVLKLTGLLNESHMVRWANGIRRLDITKPLPFEVSSVDGIYSSHTLEHLYLADARAVLSDCRRLLKPKAWLRLALPDADELVRSYLETLDPLTFNEQLNMAPLQRPRGMKVFSALATGSLHRWQPTTGLVKLMLQEAGFDTVVDCQYRMGSLPQLELVEHRQKSFFLEASHGW